MKVSELINKINEGGFNTAFKGLYGNAQRGKDRALLLARRFEKRFGDVEGAALFSAPGRTELIGNHTDHNGGVAVGAAINLDIMAVAAPADSIRIYEGDRLTEARPDGTAPKGSSAALALGMARRFGGGFVACTDSQLPVGKGVSSSAAFSLLCGKIADCFYGGNAGPMELALAAKAVENNDFGKKCGLLDQISCAFGGVVKIDFKSPVPLVEPISFDMGDYAMFLVDTGVSHAGLDGKYASIAEDMEKAAGYFGAARLADVDPALFEEKKERLRMKLGEMVYRRAQHFFNENKRVGFFCRRAELGQTFNCLYAVNGSGISSRVNLRNVHKEADDATEALKDIAAAIRIHGGGFGGAIQCYIKKDKTAAFTERMEGLFGKGSVLPVAIRGVGVCRIEDEHA